MKKLDPFEKLQRTHKPAVEGFTDGDVLAKQGDKVFVRDVGENEVICTITQVTPRRVFAQIDGDKKQQGWYFPKKWNSFGHQPYPFADGHLWIKK
jgi:hypothetical protein